MNELEELRTTVLKVNEPRVVGGLANRRSGGSIRYWVLGTRYLVLSIRCFFSVGVPPVHDDGVNRRSGGRRAKKNTVDRLSICGVRCTVWGLRDVVS